MQHPPTLPSRIGPARRTAQTPRVFNVDHSSGLGLGHYLPSHEKTPKPGKTDTRYSLSDLWSLLRGRSANLTVVNRSLSRIEAADWIKS